MKIRDLDEFHDILAARRITSDFQWASRRWVPKAVYQLVRKSKPSSLLKLTMKNFRLFEILLELSQDTQITIEALQKEATSLLINEIGYKRVEPVLRCLALLTAKYFKIFFTSIYVNETKFFLAKSKMGNNPVMFLPTHKSYLDFILISYICFHYGMDIPRIAAGMDFQSMVFVGKVLRNACSFFIRRTFTSDKLYSAVFSQYVQTLIVNDDAPIEFFIEGTRSRTEKSLVPKYGFLTMAMIPFLMGKVPDITILPINIAYDRVAEEALLVYELLGVPKPKESTKGLLKAFRLLKSCYGNAFVQFGETVSVKEFFGKEIDRSIHNYGPIDLQEPTPKEHEEIKRLAHAIVRRQQNLTILTCFNLIAAVMNHHMTGFETPLSLDDLLSEVKWLVGIFRRLGAKVAVENDIANSVSTQLALHKSFVNITPDRKVKLLRIHSTFGEIDRSVMKGYPVSDKTMDIAVPFLLVQYYSNPCAHFIVNLVFIVLIAESVSNDVSLGTLSSHFKFLRLVYSYEFVLYPETEEKDFEYAFDFGNAENVIVQVGSNVRLGENNKLRKFCISFFRNYILSYLVVIDVLMKGTAVMSAKSIEIAYQEAVESSVLLGSNIHPASLSLDLVKNALQSFARLGVVRKNLKGNHLNYEVDYKQLEELSDHLNIFSVFYKNVEVSEHFSNFVIGKL